jgi:hypothetical protein
MASGGQDSLNSESEDEEGIVAGIDEFEARKRLEMDRFIKGLGDHNENVIMHLKTINEDDEDEDDDDK